ncbi:histidine kinase [Olivibacter sp. SDN3]|uniref:ligand-binding sensor domain-containing protein n=1 Tax=Olivibacter sp. SDN3 TaxID=2764720 RepID=UPI0016511A2D|nr:sensor histidine kinase [Olivibacter sp. SDN3]QNL50548.1 histidine kinase [Olivibacter sp. SDN3]
MRRILRIVWFFLLCYQQTFSQPYYFKHYQVEGGLSNNAVICSMQDSKGFMWFGTRDGLNRFDGYSFKVFRRDARDSLQIGNNYIHSLFEDSSGNIWVGTDLGIYIYDPLTESFSPFEYNREQEILNICVDDEGNVWYTANFLLIKYDPQTKEVKSYEKEGLNGIESLAVSKEGLWMGFWDGRVERLDFNGKDRDRLSYNVFTHSSPARAKSVSSLLWDEQKNKLWIGTSKQGVKVLYVDKYDYEDLLMQNDLGEELFIRDILQVSDQEYWFASESGVYIYDDRQKKFRHLSKQDNNQWSLSDNANYTLCRDKEGGVWVGSWFGGVSYYHKQHTFFEKFFPMKGYPSLSASAVREIVNDEQGFLWIGTENGGLNRFSLDNYQFDHFTNVNDRTDLSGKNIHGLLVTGDTLWVGTFHQGLNLLHIPTGKVIRQFYAADTPDSLGSNFIYTFLRLRSGDILVATDRGAYRYQKKSGTFERIEELPDYIFYTYLFEDSQGTIWAGTWRDGLYYYHPRTQKKGLYKYTSHDLQSLPSNRITYITEDSDGRVWIATEEGLCKFDRLTARFQRYHFNRLSNGALVCAVLEDDDKQLWVSTSKGLVKFDPEKGTTQVFKMANGLLSDQFNYNSAYKDVDGKLYFGTVKGLIRFDPKSLRERTFVPPVYITGFQVYNHELEISGEDSPLHKSITFTDTLTLKYDQSSFSIDFAALSFTSPEMTEYAYKMEGLDPDWTYLQTNRKAYFTELAPGNYTFKVSTIDSKGTRMGKEAVLLIQILPPIWASIPAYILYVALTLLLIYYIVTFYHKQLKERNRRKLEQLAHRKEEEMYRSKIEFFTQVAHEIRTPLTLIRGPMEKIIKQADEVPVIRKNLLIMEKNTERLLQLSGQLLDFRKTEEQGFILRYQKIDVAAFMKEQVERVRPTAEQQQIKLKARLPNISLWGVVDLDALEKIIGNLLNNALKYAAQKIQIELSEDTAFICVKVASDGEKIPGHLREKIFKPFYRLQGNKRSVGAGLGLALARSLAELHRGSLSLDAETDENFNIFVLKLPVNRK